MKKTIENEEHQENIRKLKKIQIMNNIKKIIANEEYQENEENCKNEEHQENHRK